MTLAEKLHPQQFTAMSPLMAAIVAYIVGKKDWVEPNLVALILTSDDFLLGMEEGDCGYNHFLGAGSDLRRNLETLAQAAELDRDEYKEFAGLIRRRIQQA